MRWATPAGCFLLAGRVLFLSRQMGVGPFFFIRRSSHDGKWVPFRFSQTPLLHTFILDHPCSHAEQKPRSYATCRYLSLLVYINNSPNSQGMDVLPATLCHRVTECDSARMWSVGRFPCWLSLQDR